jgi:uncharacterized protein with von Willebrand factor type A (vWA) domain
VPADALVRHVVTFGRVLREAGLEVGPGRIADAFRGLDAVGLAGRDDVYWALRQTLVSRVDDLEAFDRAFAAWFEGSAQPPRARDGEAERRPAAVSASEQGAGSEGEPTDERGTGWSLEEVLRTKDFADLTPDELSRLRAAIARLAASRPTRRSRRLRRAPSGRVLDLRRLVRLSLATGGDPVERAFRDRVVTPRKLVVLCDVSGSMEPYSRAILLFVHALLESGRGVEAFVFGTRLTRVTEDLRGRDPERALREASKRVVDWSGGTRIGGSLKAFNDVWGRRALTRGAVVVIVSDGWEREDSTGVGREMARLARAAYAVIWVNPLKGHPEYQPLAGGMRAALPYVDRFLAGHNLASLEELAGVLAGIERRHAA